MDDDWGYPYDLGNHQILNKNDRMPQAVAESVDFQWLKPQVFWTDPLMLGR